MKYHTKNYEEVLKILNSSLIGLSNEEAIKRFKEFGPNELTSKKKNKILFMLLKQFKEIIYPINLCKKRK